MKFVRLALIAAAAGLSFACIGGSKGLSSEDREKLKPYILDSAPEISHKLDINFENKIHLIGYKMEPEVAKPGADVKLTYYWRCDDRIDEGWSLFTHLHDPVADKSDNLDWVGALRENRNNRQLLGPDKWEKGKVYVDEQTYKMPDWIRGPELNVMVGIWKGDARLRVVSGPTDGDNRASVGKIKTGVLVPAQAPHTGRDIPDISVNKLAANEKIVIDGKADEKGWEAAASSGPFVDVETGEPNTHFPVNGNVRMTWDDANLYVFFDINDSDVSSGFGDPKDDKSKNLFTATGQPKLWTRDTVEIMIDPDGDGDNKDYYELQIGPQNRVFHSQFDLYNSPKAEPNGPFGHEDWDPKLKSAAIVRGTLDKPDDKDDGYTVEASIPWAAFSKASKHPPRVGDVWRMNFYAMQQNSGVAWSPIRRQGNFHKSSRFGRVTWSVAGAPPSPTAASGQEAAQAPKLPDIKQLKQIVRTTPPRMNVRPPPSN